jgi:hypothetical protein
MRPRESTPGSQRPNGLLSVTELAVSDPDFLSSSEVESAVLAAGFRRCSRHGHLLHYTMGFRRPA